MHPLQQPVLGRRGRSPTLSPPPNYRRRLNFCGPIIGQDERRGEDLCASGDKCLGNCTSDREDHEDVCGGEASDGCRSNGVEDDPRVEDHDAGQGSDDVKKSGGRVGGRGRSRQNKKCRTRGAAAPAPWIVDPRPCAEEGNINNEDLREEEFFPSRQIEVNENGHHQAIGFISQLTQQPEAENQILHYSGHHFVLDLVLACRCFLSNPLNESNSIVKIFQFLNSSNHYSAESLRTVMVVDSLDNLAARCSQAEENIASTHFVFMLNAIQLRSKVIRFVSPISCSL